MLAITRDDAAHLMAAPKLTHVNMYVVSSALTMFDGLDAPALTNFSSRGGWLYPHTYDLRAPQLTTVKHRENSCLPRSAPNITHVHGHELRNLHHYNRIAKLTHLTIDLVWNYPSQFIHSLPQLLEELHICDGTQTQISIPWTPQSLKVIKLSPGITLLELSPDYSGTVVVVE
jgi:hypothetical protein